MSEYTKRDLRAVNLLSLVLLAIGGFLILSTVLSHVDNRTSEAPAKSAVGKETPKKGKVVSMSNGFFVKRYILGSVFALCGVALHFGLKQNSANPDGEANLAGDGD
jgi:hypothetical protein